MLDYYNQALEIVREIDIPQYSATSLNNIGELYYEQKKYDKALKCFDESIELSRGIQSWFKLVGYLSRKAKLLNNIGKVNDACSALNEAIELARKIEHPDLEKLLNLRDEIGCE